METEKKVFEENIMEQIRKGAKEIQKSGAAETLEQLASMARDGRLGALSLVAVTDDKDTRPALFYGDSTVLSTALGAALKDKLQILQRALMAIGLLGDGKLFFYSMKAANALERLAKLVEEQEAQKANNNTNQL